MKEKFGKTDTEKLCAYLQLKLQETTGDTTVTVIPTPKTEYRIGSPILRIECAASTPLHFITTDKRKTSCLLQDIFGVSAALSALTMQPEASELEAGRNHIAITTRSAVAALKAAGQNDKDTLTRSQPSPER